MTARRIGAAAVLAVLLWWGMQGTAGAHTEVLRADPQPGTEATGAIDQVSLTFLDPVQPGVTVEVTDDSGQPVAGLSTVEQSADGRTATVAFDPLTGQGGYVVGYRFTAQDGDTQSESYRFTLRPSAPGDDDDLRTDTAGIGAAALFAATFLSALAVALTRRASTPPASDSGRSGPTISGS